MPHVLPQIYLHLWDVPHLELQGRPSHLDILLHQTDAVVLVFDSSRASTLVAVDQWRNLLASRVNYRRVPLLLLAHKSDLYQGASASRQACGLLARDLDAYASASGLYGWRWTTARSSGV